jgi:hypothetical protein
MKMEDVKGWVVYETHAFPIINFQLYGHDPVEAKELVAAGKKRWAYLQGGVLALVEPGYVLDIWENFVGCQDGQAVLIG